MTLGVYCGSFAPVHNGHVGIIDEVLKEGLAEKVIVVATGDYWYKKIAIPLKKRLDCLKLIEKENIIIDEDIDDCNTQYTFDLLGRLKKKYPEAELKLILGADNLKNFRQWYHSEDLLKDYPFIIMEREGYEAAELMADLGKKDYEILKCERFDISSSYIREHLDDEELIREWLPEGVLNILKQ